MSLLKNASKVSVLTLASRVCGYIRDGVFASIFGAQAELDVFLLAFKIPNFMRRIFAEGAFSQAFIPVLTQYQNEEEDKRAEFLSKIFSMLVWSVSCLTILVWCMPAWVVTIFAYGLTKSPEKMQLAIKMVCWTFPYLGFVTLTGFFAAALQTKGRFIPGAFAPICLNIVLILGAGLSSFWAYEPIDILTMAVPVAGVMQMLVVWWGYKQCYPKIKLTANVRDTGVWKVLSLMLAAVYGVSISQVGLIVDNVILSTLAAGSVSWMYYAERLSYLPLGVFGVAMTTVLVPALACSAQSNNHQAYEKQIGWGIKGAVLVGLPAAIILSVLAEPIVITLFHYGRFSSYDVTQTAGALAILALGVPAFMMVKVLSSAFYARQDTLSPVKYATVSLVLNIIIALTMVRWWQHHAVALAVVCSAYMNLGLLYNGLVSRKLYVASSNLVQDCVKISIACLPLYGVLMCGPDDWLVLGVVGKLLALTTVITAAFSSYVGCLWLANMQIMAMVTQR